MDHAEAIERAWSRHLGTLDRSRALIVEPGRWATALHTHLLSRVVRSESNRLFLDAGTHLTGGPTRRALQVWNLDAPGDTLWDRVLFGPLCDPEDIWTRGVWSLRAPRPGDRLLLADLGAYTFTTRQPWQRHGAPWLGWDGKAVSCLWERDRFSERYRIGSEAP